MDKNLFQNFLKTLIVEFRQPLTLLMVPLEGLVNDSTLDPAVHARLLRCQHHANHLVEMVDKLSSPNELIKRYLQVNLTQVDLSDRIERLMNPFLKDKHSYDVPYTFEITLPNKDRGWLDIDKVSFIIQFVLSSLEENKGSEPCKIEFFCKTPSTYPSSLKEDWGSSIQNKEFLFVSFSNVPFFIPNKEFLEKKHLEEYSEAWGWSLCREWAQLHHGDLTFAKQSTGEIQLELCFCIDPSAYDLSNQKQDTTDNKASKLFASEDSRMVNSSDAIDNEEEDKKGRILIVEDDDLVRNLLEELLSLDYEVYTASNGLFGFEAASEHMPDLILSDWKMPKMDGVELIQKIRATEEVRNIPVILLTAYTNIETRINGLKVGADDYVDKPFHQEELLLRINNILERIRAVQRRFFKDVDMKPEHMQINKAGKELLAKAIGIVEENMENSEFRVEDFSDHMNMHKNSLNRKLKAITGLTANAFIRNLRLKNAAKMLLDGEDNVAGVSYRVGFVDQRYFSRIFKHHFGIPPSKYVEAYKAGTLKMDQSPLDALDPTTPNFT
ncbi:MAG: response regulator [Bacteroidota bacterium]